MSEQGYQGYKNYETWNAALWLANEQGSYHYWQGRAERIKNLIANGCDDLVQDCDLVSGTWTAEQAARFLLANELEVCEHPLTSDASMYNDLLTHSLGQVDWEEVADSILAE